MKLMQKKLYRWQSECLNKWNENNHQGIVNVVTGAGKTTLALSAIKEVFDDNIKIKIVVPTINLLFQWKKEILNYFGEKYESQINLYYGGTKNKKDTLFSIYVINSARHAVARSIIDDMNLGFNVMFVADETHHYTSKENQKIFHYLLSKDFKKDKFFSLGLSATIDADDLNNILIPSLGKVIYLLNHNEALNDHIISPFVIYETSINFMPIERDEYISITYNIDLLYKKLILKYDYLKYINNTKEYMKLLHSLSKEDEDVDIYLKLLLKRKKISSTSKTRIMCGVEIIKQLYDKRIIVFAEKISQIKEFEKALRNEGVKSVSCYHSNQSQEYRKQILQDYKNGNINVLLTCRALDEGVDVPDAEIAILLSSSSVPRQRIQRLGRVLRKNNNKQMASLFYLYVSDANDEVLFLEDLSPAKNIVMRIRFFNNDKNFTNQQYEDHVYKYYKKLRKDTKDLELLKEYIRCLEKGTIRTDWLLSKKELEIKTKDSITTSEKNYYIVMKKICLG